MKRALGSAIGILVVIGALAPNALVQTDVEPTVAALQTQVSDLSTRVAALESAGQTPVRPTPGPSSTETTEGRQEPARAPDVSQTSIGTFQFSVIDVHEQSEITEENGF
jgi:hypothetical protein